MAPPLILGLDTGWCPPTVRRFVVSVWVDAIQRGALRTWPHVGIELLKRVPFGADRNATSGVVLVTLSSLVTAKAAISHSAPGIPLRGVQHAVFRITGPSAFGHLAPTRVAAASVQACLKNYTFSPALAATLPSRLAIALQMWHPKVRNQRPSADRRARTQSSTISTHRTDLRCQTPGW